VPWSTGDLTSEGSTTVTSPGDNPEDRRVRNKATHWVVGALAVAALVGLVLFLVLGNALQETT
jgi:hypothetical protein